MIINLHYEGIFGEWGYFGGEVSQKFFDVDDSMTLHSFDCWLKELGVIGNVQYYWRKPGLDFNSGTSLLVCV